MSNPNDLRTEEGKKNVSSETSKSHLDEEQLKLIYKREAHRRRNESYVRVVYGNSKEREEVRRRNRVSLQQQIHERDENHRQMMKNRFSESEFAINYDKACLHQDAEDRTNRHNYLKTFRDENKKLIEMRAEQLRKEREATHQHERQLLTLSPINWNKTLN